MQDKDVAKKMIEVAIKGEHRPLEKLTTLNGLFAARIYKNASSKMARQFKVESKRLFKTYLKQKKADLKAIKSGNYTKQTARFQNLLDSRVMEECAKYYEEEALNTRLIIAEFHYNYMLKFHIIDTLLGKDREDE